MDEEIMVDVRRAAAKAVGAEHGFTQEDLDAYREPVQQAHTVLMEQRRQGAYGFWDLYKDKAAFEDVQETAAACLEQGFENLVVLGIGGSALGARALATALKDPYHNLMTRGQRKNFPRLFVMDNIDPMTFRSMMRICQPKKTLYNVISKSGGTAETMSQLMIVLEAISKKVGEEAIKDHVIVTTNPRGEGMPASHLHTVADAYGLKSFAVPYNVGGRFSVFSPVGMFPAAMLGMDIEAMREGCEAMDKRCASPEFDANPAYQRAVVQYIADTRKGKHISVMMPYADALREVADWYAQLWAESLGKRFNLEGEPVHTGQTPVKALGATDQHSQLQLYREGPNDKIINILEVRRFDRTLRIPDVLHEVDAVSYLRNKSMNKLMSAELRGTIDALKMSQRPVSLITLPRVNGFTVAQVLYMLEAETAMAGQLYNVNAFDQPGVEESKIIARQLMGGQG